MRIHGFEVIAFTRTRADNSGVVLVDRGPGQGADMRYVTALYREGESEWLLGHYFDDKAKAVADFNKRVMLDYVSVDGYDMAGRKVSS